MHWSYRINTKINHIKARENMKCLYVNMIFYYKNINCIGCNPVQPYQTDCTQLLKTNDAWTLDTV
jgi:hypothetical protein